MTRSIHWRARMLDKGMRSFPLEVIFNKTHRLLTHTGDPSAFIMDHDGYHATFTDLQNHGVQAGYIAGNVHYHTGE